MKKLALAFCFLLATATAQAAPLCQAGTESGYPGYDVVHNVYVIDAHEVEAEVVEAYEDWVNGNRHSVLVLEETVDPDIVLARVSFNDKLPPPDIATEYKKFRAQLERLDAMRGVDIRCALQKHVPVEICTDCNDD